MINTVIDFVFQTDFQIAFWSNLLSDAGFAIILAILIKCFTSVFNHPELTMVVKQKGEYGDQIKIEKRKDGDYEASFMLAIKNRGNETFKANEGFWHLYFPNAEKIEILDGANTIASGETNHLRDLINLPIYPKSFLDFGPEHRMIIKKELFEKISVHYFFSTNYGYFPKTVKLDQKTAFVPFSTMGKIEFIWPKDISESV